MLNAGVENLERRGQILALFSPRGPLEVNDQGPQV